MHARLEQIPAGDPGLATKLRRMREIVDVARADPRFRARALGLVRHVKERDHAGELAAVSRHVRRMRYTRDPYGVELFTDPRLMLDDLAAGFGAGDCDDASLLGAALLESIGYPTRFRVGGFKDDRGRSPSWAHVWVEALHPARGWVAIDDTAKRRPPGWDPSPRFDVTTTSDQPMVRRHTIPAALACYGGARPLQTARSLDGLDGFSLKKLAKKVFKPVQKVVSKVVPKPLKKIGRQIDKKLTQPFVKLQTKAFGLGLKPLAKLYKQAAPLVGMVGANILAPGSGAIVGSVVGRFTGDESIGPPLMFEPDPEPYVEPVWEPPPALQPIGPSFATHGAGGSSGGGGSYYATEESSSWPLSRTQTIVAAAAVAGGLFLLARRRRGRRR